MFPSSYFAPRYLATRYWPKVGFGQAILVPADLVSLTVTFARSVHLSALIARSRSLTATLARTINLTVER
jgi:hypothetical protein